MHEMKLYDLLHACVAARRGTSNVELEMRLGQMNDSFSPGVPRTVFEQLERDLVDTSDLCADPGYTEIVDYFYTLPRGRKVRTRVHFDSSTMEMRTEHVEKRMVTSFIASVSSDAGDTCRVEVSNELPVECPPQWAFINYVRVKQRRSFIDRRDGGDVWRYELSRVWSGTTRDSVEHSQHNSEPLYEVECELVDSLGAYMDQRNDLEVSKSLHLKMLMLLGYDDADTHIEISNARNNDGVGLKRQRNQN